MISEAGVDVLEELDMPVPVTVEWALITVDFVRQGHGFSGNSTAWNLLVSRKVR